MQKGITWNESSVYNDAVTLRKMRRLTSRGMLNTIPSYHTGQSFTADGGHVLFISFREGHTCLCKAELATGALTALIEPVAGLGGLCEVHSFGDGKGIPIGPVLGPTTHWAYYVVARQIRAVNLDTLHERLMLDGVEEKFFVESIALTCDEKKLVYILSALRPQKRQDFHFRVCSIDLATGEHALIMERQGINGTHLMNNPTAPDLFLIGQDLGPSPSDRSDDNGRNWILNIATGGLVNLKTDAQQNFQTHTCWTWDGKEVLYHGMLAGSRWENDRNENGWYIGKTGLDGNVKREFAFPDAPYYGHVSAMKGKDAVILDGNLLNGLLTWLYLDGESPRVEVIARHDSDFTVMPGQYTHPHTICDPTGRRLVFNSARKKIFVGGRSDVYTVEV